MIGQAKFGQDQVWPDHVFSVTFQNVQSAPSTLNPNPETLQISILKP